jgi:hypothetical protein
VKEYLETQKKPLRDKENWADQEIRMVQQCGFLTAKEVRAGRDSRKLCAAPFFCSMPTWPRAGVLLGFGLRADVSFLSMFWNTRIPNARKKGSGGGKP